MTDEELVLKFENFDRVIFDMGVDIAAGTYSAAVYCDRVERFLRSCVDLKRNRNADMRWLYIYFRDSAADMQSYAVERSQRNRDKIEHRINKRVRHLLHVIKPRLEVSACGV